MSMKLATPLGVVTMLQLLPSQCSVNGPKSWSPTAQISLAETAAAATRELLPCGFGFGRDAQDRMRHQFGLATCKRGSEPGKKLCKPD